MESGGFFRPKEKVLKAVDGVSFSLRNGEALGIVGESGCGKSTLGRAILKFAHITGGRVTWLGRDLSGSDKREMKALRREMQVVFQDPLSSHNPRMTVGSIIGEPLTVFRPEMSRKERESEVIAMMEGVGLSREMMNRYPHELSGGQCQRASIARAMILKPKLVICDEPVSALDVSTQAQVINLLRRLQRDHGVSLIFISHDLSVVRHLCQRILVMYLGRMAEIGDREQIFDDPKHPYTQTLINAVPTPDPRIQRAKARMSVRGEVPSPLSPPSGCVFRTRCPFSTQVCRRRVPELETVGEGHRVACHHWRKNESLLARPVTASAVRR